VAKACGHHEDLICGCGVWKQNVVQVRREPWTFIDLTSVPTFVALTEYVGKHRPKE
jgi:hypothetical protein